MLMKWDRTTISASEVNRYTYCPYQWYFERYYGRNKLSQMAKAKKAEPKLKQVKKTPEQKRQSHFARGRAYHAKEYQIFKRKQKMVWITIITVFILCVIFFIFIFIK